MDYVVKKGYKRRYKRSEAIVFRKTKEAFGGLSNMAAGFPIRLEDLIIATSENLYQALRFPDFPDLQYKIISINNPMQAKMLSRKHYSETRTDWEYVKVKIMRLVLHLKLISNWNNFGQILYTTGKLPIVEESRKDTFWGAKPVGIEYLEGVNALGRLLMELREHFNIYRYKDIYELTLELSSAISNLRFINCQISDLIRKGIDEVKRENIQTTLFEFDVQEKKQHVQVLFKKLMPHTAYKDSGVVWLGKVPEKWNVMPLKHWVHINCNTLPENTNPDFEFEYYDISSIRTGELIRKPEIIKFKDAPSRARRLLRPGDTVFSTVRTYLKATFTYRKSKNSRLPSVASTGFAVFTPRKGSIPGYIGYLMKAEELASYISASSVGIAYPATSEATFGSIKVPVPTVPEQRAIVKFLDWADRRIKLIIAARKRRIQLLEEYRQVLINDAVTGKFDVRTGEPYPAYKDSGVEWLGKVPEGWRAMPLKHWARINPDTLHENTDPDFEFEYYDISSVGTGKLIEEPEKITFKNAPSRARRPLQPGDTIFSTVRTYLKATFTYWESRNRKLPAVASTGFAVLRPSQNSYPAYVGLLMQSEGLASYISALSVGIAYPAIAESTFASIKVPVPPLPEQRAIAEYLDRETAKIDEAIEKTKKSIALWEELRTTLIADVVTGKYDVRELAEVLPEEEPELEAKIEILEASLQGGENEADEGVVEEAETVEETA